MSEQEIRADERRCVADWLLRKADDHAAIASKYSKESGFYDRIAADALYGAATRLSSGPVGEQTCEHCGAPSGISAECKPCARRIMGLRPR